MTYMQFILDYLNEQDFGVPIYTEMIAGKMADYFDIEKKKASAATAVAMKRIIDDNKLPDLRFYQNLRTDMPAEAFVSKKGERSGIGE